MLAAAAGAAAGSMELPAEGPSGAPSGGVTSHYSGDLVSVGWVNGDATASTQVYIYSPGCPAAKPDDLTYLRTAVPGATSLSTGRTEHCSYWLRHVKNGQYSTWHQVVAGIEVCAACPA